MYVQSDYPDPIMGVSTSPEVARPIGYMNEQVNMRADRNDMLVRRPPLESVNEGVQPTYLVGTDSEDKITGKVTWIDPSNDRYSLFATQHHTIASRNALYLEKNGQLQTLVNGNNANLMHRLDANIRMARLDGRIFLWDTARTVEMQDTTEADFIPHKRVAMIRVIASANYNEGVSVQINQHPVTTYTTTPLPVSTSSSAEADASRTSERIAIELAALINALPDVEAIRQGSVVVVTSTTVDVTIAAVGSSDELLKIVNWKTDSPEGLPKNTVSGMRVKIEPDPSNAARGAYWLKAVPTDGSADYTGTPALSTNNIRECIWVETRDPEIQAHEFNPLTMPHELVFTTQWEIVPVEWQPREAGDVESNPPPNIVGESIRDMQFIQGRLVLVSAKAVAMSRTKEHTSFFRNSMAKLLVTDTIDLQTAGHDSGSFEWATQHSGELLVFSDRAQFKVGGREAITPETAAITLVSHYACDTRVRPITMGNMVLFLSVKAGRPVLLAYAAGKDTGQDTAIPLSDEYNTALEGGVLSLVGSEELKMVLVGGTYATHVLEYDFDGDGFTRLAWHEWRWAEQSYPVIPDARNVAPHMHFHLGVLYVWKRDVLGRLLPCVLNFEDTPIMYADALIKFPLTYYMGEYRMPHGVSRILDFENRPIYWDMGDYLATGVLELRGVGGSARWYLNVGDDEPLSNDFYWGYPFESMFVPGRPLTYNREGVPETADRVRVSKFAVDVVDTTELKMDIISKWTSYDTQVVSPEIVGQFVLGTKEVLNKRVTFAFGSTPAYAYPKFHTRSLGDLRVTKIGWEGIFTRRAKRI